MKKLLFVSIFAGALLAVAHGQFGLAQTVPVTTNYVKFAQVPIPQDQTYYCGAPAWAPLCNLSTQLVALNLPAVDAVLIQQHMVVVSPTGSVLFDYTLTPPRPNVP